MTEPVENPKAHDVAVVWLNRRFCVARCSCSWVSEPCLKFVFATHLGNEHAGSE